MNESSAEFETRQRSDTPQMVLTSQLKQPFIYEEDLSWKDDNIDNEIIVERYRDLRRQQK
jgi:hypothetical protein